MDNGKRDADEQYSQLLSSYEESLFNGQTPTDNGNMDPSLDLGVARRFARTKRCLKLLDEVWPSNDAGQRRAGLLSDKVARFEIVRELGRGGFGIVYLADDPKLGRAVALKVQRPETVFSAELRRRFLREAKTAAALSHPHIVPTFDAEVEGVVCWIASEYCRGPSLKTWLEHRGAPVPADAAAELVLALAEAIGYAHTRGVLHRDIKTGNVLLQLRDDVSVGDGHRSCENDAAGQATDLDELHELSSYVPKLTDFGLAKFDDEATDETHTGAQLGTPAYMAPEQIEGDRAKIDRRTDVYGLGIVLYELLTGELPFEGQTRTETLSQVLLREPRRPRKVRRDLPRDLEAIVLRCLEKHAENRYSSALALADDLRRFLAGEPTAARPIAAWERLGKWSRRHPALALLLTIVLTVFPAASAIIAVQNAELADALNEAKWKEQEAYQQRTLAEQEAHKNAQTLYALRMRTTWDAYNGGDVATVDEMLKHYQVAKLSEFCSFEYAYLKELRATRPLTLKGHVGQVYAAAFSPDGQLLATGAEDHLVKLWDPGTGECLATLAGHLADVNCVAFSPDGETLASASDDGTIRLWNVATRISRAILTSHEDEVVGLRFAPNGRLLVSGDSAGVVIVWEIASLRPLRWLQRHLGRIDDLDVSPDSRFILTGGSERMLHDREGAAARLWDLAEDREVWSQDYSTIGSVQCVGFEPEGGGYVVGDSHGNLSSWDRAGRPVGFWDDSAVQLKAVAFSRDGAIRATADATGHIVVTRRSSWPGTSVLHAHEGTAWSVALSPDGSRLATVGRDGTVKIWDPRQDVRYQLHDFGSGERIIASDFSGTHVVKTDSSRQHIVIATAKGPDVLIPVSVLGRNSMMQSAALAGDRPLAAIGCTDNYVVFYDYQRSRVIGEPHRLDHRPNRVFFTADNRRLFCCDSERSSCFDVSHLDDIRRIDAPAGSVANTSGNGELATVFNSERKDISKFWQRIGPDWREKWNWGIEAICVPVFTRDGRFVVVADRENSVTVREAATGRITAEFKISSIVGSKLAISPDGKTLAIQSPGRLKLWSIPAAMQVLEVSMPMSAEDMEFTADGSALILRGRSFSPSDVSRKDGRPVVPTRNRSNGDVDPESPHYGVIVLST